MLGKLKWQISGEPLSARYNWCQGPGPGRGPAVEKHWFRRYGVGGVALYLDAYLSSTLDGIDWVASRSGRIVPLKMCIGTSQNNSGPTSCQSRPHLLQKWGGIIAVHSDVYRKPTNTAIAKTSNFHNVKAGGICRVSQEEWTKLRESVPYVKLYRYNPKHLYPKLNGYGDNGQRSLKLWQLLHTYWLPNTY